MSFHGTPWQRHPMRLLLVVMLVIGVWVSGLGVGGLMGMRYQECRLPERDIESMVNDIERRLLGLGTAQIGVAQDSPAAEYFRREEEQLRRYLADLQAFPAGGLARVGHALTKCPATWSIEINTTVGAAAGGR